MKSLFLKLSLAHLNAHILLGIILIQVKLR